MARKRQTKREQSPIESMLLDEMIDSFTSGGVLVILTQPGVVVGSADDDDAAGMVMYGDDTNGTVVISPQARLEQYKCDFLLAYTNGRGIPCRSLIVECDGHDWHERTQQQAAYDRSRDRDLLLRGHSTIRFTGSEIVRDANRCANEVVETLKSKVHHLHQDTEAVFHAVAAEFDRPARLETPAIEEHW